MPVTRLEGCRTSNFQVKHERAAASYQCTGRAQQFLYFLSEGAFSLRYLQGPVPGAPSSPHVPETWQEGPHPPYAPRWESLRSLLVGMGDEDPFPGLLKRFVDSTNGFLTQGRRAGDRYKSGGIIASRCCLSSSPGPCVFQHPASSSEQNQGVGPKSGAGPSGFKQLKLQWLLISPHLPAAGAVLCGRGSRPACELQLGLSQFRQPLNWGFMRNAECCGTGDAIRNWQHGRGVRGRRLSRIRAGGGCLRCARLPRGSRRLGMLVP